nr:hypothetical protein [Burkholderia ambifaria]
MERGIERQLEDPLRKIGRGDSSVQTAVELQMRMIRFEVWHEVVANSVKRLNGAIETLTR